MKKILIASLSVLVLFTTFACIVLTTPNTVLNLLNWGEYISDDLIDEFQKKYHCQVVLETVTSSEAMYQKITSETTNYDVAIPGDYIVHQLYDENLLMELDVNNKDYENLNDYQNIFSDGLTSLMKKYMVNDENNEFNSYFMPYFWGSYSMLYSKSKESTKDILETNGFKALWNRNLFSDNVKIGMYDTARWIVASYLLSKDLDPNITDYDNNEASDLSDEIKNDCIAALKQIKFDEFGNDSLKRNVANGSLDFCYTQSGDFFDALYLVYSSSSKNVTFNITVPKTTAAFFDAMVIPKTCQNYSLANTFINFMLDKSNAYKNARDIGYSPTLKSVVSLFEESAKNNENYFENDDITISMKEFLEQYPMYLNPLYNTEKVYMLKPKSKEYLTTCETIFNSLA